MTGVRIGFLFVVMLALVFFVPPRRSFDERLVVIEEGMTMADVARRLEEERVVFSDAAVRLVSLVRRGDTLVQAGTYVFHRPLGAWEAVTRLARGVFGVEIVRVRLSEGSTRVQMADVLSETLPLFKSKDFLMYTEGSEGYLFPDTYFFFETETATSVVERLTRTFNTRMEQLAGALLLSGRTREEVVTLASIIEREAHDPEDQRLISGVLWNRLDIGMALQADATLYYILGKPSSELTKEDLEIDSPYNTYAYPGLPPGPIGNPGLGAIEAALNPTPSDYFYYLSDEDGVTYFAETFEEHKANRELYLR